MRGIRQRLLIWLLPGLGLLWGASGTAIYYSVKRGLEAKLDSELQALVSPVRFLAWTRLAGEGRPLPPTFSRDLDIDGFERPGGGRYFHAWELEGEIKSASLGGEGLERWARFGDQARLRDLRLADGEQVRALGVKLRPPPTWRRGGGRGGRFGPPRGPEREGDGDGDGDGLQEDERSFRENRPERLDRFGRGGPRGDGSDPGDEFDRERGRGPGPGPRGAFGGDGRFRSGDEFDLVVAVSRAEVDQTLAMLLGGISFSGLIAVLASALLIRVALRSGLSPLQRVGQRAAAIDASSLQSRFDTGDMPEELLPIGEALNGLMGRLEAGFERERRFSADLAHELRTPVAELKSMAEVAIRWPEQAEAENYEEVKAISERMQATIENLLQLARLEKSAARESAKPVRLAGIIREMWQPHAKTATARGLRVEFAVPDDAELAADEQLLRVIVSNLLSNAAEYAPKDSPVEVRFAADGGLTVRNPAGEIGAEDLPHLFERLWRRDPSRTDSTHSGLGLPLARSCAEACGLELTAGIDAEKAIVFRLEKRRDVKP